MRWKEGASPETPRFARPHQNLEIRRDNKLSLLFLDFGPPSYVAEGGHGFWRGTFLPPRRHITIKQNDYLFGSMPLCQNRDVMSVRR